MLAGLAAGVVYLVARRSSGRAAAAAGALAVVAFPGAATILRAGMEGAVDRGLLAAAVACATRWEPADAGPGRVARGSPASFWPRPVRPRLEALVATPVAWGAHARRGLRGHAALVLRHRRRPSSSPSSRFAVT
jgi:hypothetical protein